MFSIALSRWNTRPFERHDGKRAISFLSDSLISIDAINSNANDPP